MIDTLSIFLPEAYVSPDILKNYHLLSAGEGFQGLLRNIRVTQARKGVFLNGSLPKYLYGSNTLVLTRSSIQDGLRLLEQESGLDLRAGFVYRMETAVTLPVRESPRTYLSAWGPLGRFQKDTYGNGQTVLYRNGSRSFMGYDKGAETAPKPLPVPFEGLFALRMELKHKRGLKRVLGRPMSPWELTKPDSYVAIVDRWKQFYFAIPKRKEVSFHMTGMTEKQLERTLAALGLLALGQDRIDQLIKDGQSSGVLDRTTAWRLRKRVRDIGMDEHIVNVEPLTEEVDDKVRVIARYTR